jgi:hypothetical protein
MRGFVCTSALSIDKGLYYAKYHRRAGIVKRAMIGLEDSAA